MNKSYCINPLCEQRINQAIDHHCPHCGNHLLVGDRYRLLEPLRELNPVDPTEIFVVQDWAAWQANWGITKVLKVLKFGNNPDLVHLFQQQARALIFLRHRAIPQVEPDGYFIIKTNQHQTLHCLVMQHIKGENLESWLAQNQPIEPNLILTWWQQLAAILEILHYHHIIHRDVKLSNLLVGENQELSLIDFGSVQIGKSDRQEGGYDQIKIGSFGYAAPEQIAGKTVFQSDFFSLGRTLVHLITGISPLDLETVGENENLVWRDQASYLWDNLHNKDEIFDQIDGMMAQDFHKRISSQFSGGWCPMATPRCAIDYALRHFD